MRGEIVSEMAFLDARGLACPMPLLKAKLALNALQMGEQLKVVASDRGSVRDFHSFANLSEHTIVTFEENDGEFTYIIQKG